MSEAPFGDADSDSDADSGLPGSGPQLTPAAFLQKYRHGQGTARAEFDDLVEHTDACLAAVGALPLPETLQEADSATGTCVTLLLRCRADEGNRQVGRGLNPHESYDFLTLRLQGAGWIDYLADALPRIIASEAIGHCIGSVEDLASRVLVDLKRNPGGAFLTDPLSVYLEVDTARVMITCGGKSTDVEVAAVKAGRSWEDAGYFCRDMTAQLGR